MLIFIRLLEVPMYKLNLGMCLFENSQQARALESGFRMIAGNADLARPIIL